MEKKLGVVIFNDDYFSHEGLAALEWASILFPESETVRILLVRESDEQSQSTVMENSEKKIKKKGYEEDALFNKVNKRAKNNESNKALTKTFEVYAGKFGKKDELGTSYKGSNIHEMLEEAIKDFQLDMLVIGMEAIGSTSTGDIDVLLRSQCSVMLVRIDDPQALEAEDDDRNGGAPSPAVRT